jgi:hypothetical protein
MAFKIYLFTDPLLYFGVLQGKFEITISLNIQAKKMNISENIT